MTPKIALVTGASRGIGKAIAVKLAQHHYRVAIGYHTHQDQAVSLAETLEGSMPVPIDVSDADSVSRAFSLIEAQLGRVDLLVNNAGIVQPKPFLEISDDDWQQMLSVNLMGAVRCSRCALPAMIEQGWGRIVNIASLGGQSGGVYQPHYAAAKAGLINFTRSLARLYSAHGITSNAIAPGLIETDMIAMEMQDSAFQSRLSSIPSKRIGHPDEIASAVLYLASDEAGYVTGQTINVNGGMYFG